MKIICKNSNLEFQTVRPIKEMVFYNYGYLAVGSGGGNAGLSSIGSNGWSTNPLNIDTFERIVIEKASLSSSGWLMAFYSTMPTETEYEEMTDAQRNQASKQNFIAGVSVMGDGLVTNYTHYLDAAKQNGAHYVIISLYTGIPPTEKEYSGYLI